MSFSLDYSLEKMITQGNNHTLKERLEYGEIIKEKIKNLSIDDTFTKFLIEILNRFTEHRKDINLLDVSIYSSYFRDILDEPDYKIIKNSLTELMNS
tara:strand:+ start:108 stop:398 length:291 start_codon:yes stop_codon:yes gene_type:complete